jgi:hypothetical protein
MLAMLAEGQTSTGYGKAELILLMASTQVPERGSQIHAYSWHIC